MKKSPELSDISRRVSKILEPPKLFKHACKDIDIFYTPDTKKEMGLKSEIYLDIVASKTVENFLGLNPDYNELIDFYAHKNNLERIAILMAHGDEFNGKWCYFDNEKSVPVQNWINRMDGKYRVLILSSCNPGRSTIESKKSPILVPNESYSPMLSLSGKVQVELFLPEKGYIDSYLMEGELKKIRV